MQRKARWTLLLWLRVVCAASQFVVVGKPWQRAFQRVGLMPGQGLLPPCSPVDLALMCRCGCIGDLPLNSPAFILWIDRRVENSDCKVSSSVDPPERQRLGQKTPSFHAWWWTRQEVEVLVFQPKRAQRHFS